MAQDDGPIDPISEWEQNPSPEALERLVEACRRDPAAALRLARRDLELFRSLQESHGLLAEAKQVLEERQNGVRHVAAFIEEGPLTVGGAATAIVDKGGQRCVVPIADGIGMDELRKRPVVLLNDDAHIVGTLEGYEPPSEVGRVVEAADRHLLVELHAEERLRVDVCHPLRGHFREGDRALIDRRHSLVITRLPADERNSEWQLEVSPRERFGDVAGQDQAIGHIIERVIWPLERPDLIDRFGLGRTGGILLYGPSGCGKTLIGRATAGELEDRFGKECVFLRVKAGALKSKWYGETTARIQRLWQFARREAARGRLLVLFMDEIDSLAGARSVYGGEYGTRADHDATNALLAELDGFDSGDRSLPIVTIASTNLPSALDVAFMGRFAVQICIARPDAEGADRMFRIHLNHGVPMETPENQMVERVVDFIFHDHENALLTAYMRDGKQVETIRRSHLLTGRLVRDCVEKSKWKAVRDVIVDGAEPVLRIDHLLRALDEQFVETARKLTPHNVGDFVDLPTVRDGQVARLSPVVPPAPESWQYVA
jgi:proteasome-associated ATPase